LSNVALSNLANSHIRIILKWGAGGLGSAIMFPSTTEYLREMSSLVSMAYQTYLTPRFNQRPIKTT